jgi:hypothetical protein
VVARGSIVNDQTGTCPESHPAGGNVEPPVRVVRLARDAYMAHLSPRVMTFSEVELLDSLGLECSGRGGDADALDQLAFRLRARLTADLAIIAAVRRRRAAGTQEEKC